MELIEFQNFIQNIPYQNQAFDIKKENWKVESQQELIDKVFKGKDIITLNRQDLINSTFDLKEFILKTLMWGYPTKGRGRNIENMLETKTFEQLVKVLELYKSADISIEQLKRDIKEISGLGLSTITKFTHFLDTTINGNKAVILDIQIIEAIKSNRFKDFEEFIGISYENAQNYYPRYLEKINSISNSLNATPDQVEMFLFTFGRTLSPVKSTLQDKMNSAGTGTIVTKPVVKEDQQDIYRKRLIEAYKSLVNFHSDIFSASLNLAMAGELKEIDEAFDAGDTYNFDIEHLKGTNDTNLNKFLEFYEQLENLMNSIANINAIKEKELE
jgi:hypothetical protein